MIDKLRTALLAIMAVSAVLAVVFLMAGCRPVVGPSTSAAGAVGGSANTTTTAAAAAPGPEHVPAGTLDIPAARAKLQVAVPGDMDGYERECIKGHACVFGQPWKDVDHNGCDQRSQVLARDLANVERKPGRCSVTAGTLADPYTDATLTVVSKIQIDHVVPLGEMWRSGAAD